jgi:hypothetical protein
MNSTSSNGQSGLRIREEETGKLRDSGRPPYIPVSNAALELDLLLSLTDGLNPAYRFYGGVPHI